MDNVELARGIVYGVTTMVALIVGFMVILNTIFDR